VTLFARTLRGVLYCLKRPLSLAESTKAERDHRGRPVCVRTSELKVERSNVIKTQIQELFRVFVVGAQGE
jgi:hypothetical protein